MNNLNALIAKEFAEEIDNQSTLIETIAHLQAELANAERELNISKVYAKTLLESMIDDN